MSLIVSKTKEQIKSVIKNAALKAIEQGELPAAELNDFTIEAPSNREHGDYAVNAAMLSTPKRLILACTMRLDRVMTIA